MMRTRTLCGDLMLSNGVLTDFIIIINYELNYHILKIKLFKRKNANIYCIILLLTICAHSIYRGKYIRIVPKNGIFS